MNWKIIVGILLLVGAVSEMFSIIGDYRSGKLKSWPLGVEFGLAAIMALAIYLIIKGRKESQKRL